MYNRFRTCGQGCHGTCAGDAFQTSLCNTQPCRLRAGLAFLHSPVPAVNCTVGDYRTLTCSASCGGGVGQLQRVVLSEAMYGGLGCSYADVAVITGACNTQPCRACRPTRGLT